MYRIYLLIRILEALFRYVRKKLFRESLKTVMKMLLYSVFFITSRTHVKFFIILLKI